MIVDSLKESSSLWILQNRHQLLTNTTYNLLLLLDGDLDLAFGIETLQEETLLISYKIRHLSNIHTTLKLPGGI